MIPRYGASYTWENFGSKLQCAGHYNQGWQARDYYGRDAHCELELAERDAAVVEQALLHDRVHRDISLNAGNASGARSLARSMDHG